MQQPIAARRQRFMSRNNQTIHKPSFAKYTTDDQGTAFTDLNALRGDQFGNNLPIYVPQIDNIIGVRPNMLFLGLPKNRDDLVDFFDNPNEYMPGKMTFANAMRAGRQYGVLKYKNPSTGGMYTVGSNGYFLLAQDEMMPPNDRKNLYILALLYFQGVPSGIDGRFAYDTVVPAGASTLGRYDGHGERASDRIPYSSKEAYQLLRQSAESGEKLSATSMRGLSYLVKNNVQRQAGWKGYTALAKQDPDRVLGAAGQAIRQADNMNTVVTTLDQAKGTANLSGARLTKENRTYSLGPKLTMYRNLGNGVVGEPLLERRSGYEKGRYGNLRQQGEVCPGGQGLVGYLASDVRHQSASASNRVNPAVSTRLYRARCADTNPSEYPVNPDMLLASNSNPYSKRFSTSGLSQQANTPENRRLLVGQGTLRDGLKYAAINNPTPQSIASASRQTRQQRKRVSRGPEALARLEEILAAGQGGQVQEAMQPQPAAEEELAPREDVPQNVPQLRERARTMLFQVPLANFQGNTQKRQRTTRTNVINEFNRMINAGEYARARNLLDEYVEVGDLFDNFL